MLKNIPKSLLLHQIDIFSSDEEIMLETTERLSMKGTSGYDSSKTELVLLQ